MTDPMGRLRELVEIDAANQRESLRVAHDRNAPVSAWVVAERRSKQHRTERAVELLWLMAEILAQRKGD